MLDPLDAPAASVPSVGQRQLVLVDGRTFAISDDAGQMHVGTHGLVHDDLRHVSRFEMRFEGAGLEVLATHAPTPLSAVVVARLVLDRDPSVQAVVTRRRWIADGLRDDIHIHNTSPLAQRWTVGLTIEADFAHIFDVKAGLRGTPRPLVRDDNGWRIQANGVDAATLLQFQPPPDHFDAATSEILWSLAVAPREDLVVTVTVEPVVDGLPAGLAFPIGLIPADAIPMRRLRSRRETVPRVVSNDPRLAPIVDQALSDIAALRIVDAGHPERTAIAAGAPWFMTLFGRDSLLTSWMTLPFDPALAVGVLAALADLQGTSDDPVAEEQPGKILHELRRRGGGGPFASRQRYYGTVDATPLFVMLAAEAHRWGALSNETLDQLHPAIDAAVEWMLRNAESNGEGFIDYRRSHSSGLSNQGWKDSWDGVNSADGSLPSGPIALAEVQGYAYAAYLGAAELSTQISLTRSGDELIDHAHRLRQAFNDRFWSERGWFVVGLDGDGRQIDALTTNPGHAMWTGIADESLANRHLDRFSESTMWTGWGLRTLGERMHAYDPLSYHNGSVWPHDTALCAAGAARYKRWDIVDQIVDGALDAAGHFGGRPPELFAGIARDEAPMPVAYPASCSPQAWSSASILLLIRALLDMNPSPDRASIRIDRPDISTVSNMQIEHLAVGARRFTLTITDGISDVEMDHPAGNETIGPA